jgi:hypothetical protein
MRAACEMTGHLVTNGAALAAEDPCAVAVLRAVFAVHQLWFNAAHRPSRLDECVERVEAHLAPSWRARA